MSRLPTLLLACLLLAIAGCGEDDEEKAAPASTATATPTPDARGTGGEQGTGCEPAGKPRTKDPDYAKPRERLDPARTYVATVKTNCGTFEITLDAERAPKTGGSFKFLADKGFFDGLGFHRIVPGFVIQGGDPKGNGSGGPGYSIVEAPPEDLTYDKGVVAMAKTDLEDPGHVGQPVLRRHGRRHAAAARVRPAREGHEGPGGRRPDRRRARRARRHAGHADRDAAR